MEPPPGRVRAALLVARAPGLRSVPLEAMIQGAGRIGIETAGAGANPWTIGQKKQELLSAVGLTLTEQSDRLLL